MNREDKFALLDKLTIAKGSVSPVEVVLKRVEIDWLRALVSCELVRETVMQA